ncbi:sterol O-acyltransferase 1-like [Dysidea avara]|uniref:sterol O-acyltransferase 1-like n=1 Tax=Dysidea avara TaxID=196820 RepID=UPI003330B01F
MMCHVASYLKEMSDLREGQELRSREEKKDKPGEGEDTGRSTAPPKKKWQRRYRIFRLKESVLTELLETNPHIQSLFNIGIVMTLLLWLFDIMKNSAVEGRLYLDMTTYHVVFGPWQKQLVALGIWLVLMGTYFMIHPIFKVWVYLHKTMGRPADVLFVILCCLYNIVAHTSVILLILYFDFDTGPSLFLSIEQTRFTLKCHSFVRENAYKVLWPWDEDDETGPPVWYEGQMSPKIGSLSQYMYFTFAPTLVYRDHYPRLKNIRLGRGIWYLLQFGGIISCTIIILKNFIRPHLQLLEENPVMHGILALTNCTLVGVFFMVMAGTCFLHCWQNFGGEMTLFGDRQFYGAWWRCLDYRNFYREWNLLVHDWIYCYIYQDLRSFLGPKFVTMSVFTATFMSSLFHEYILATGMKFFLPLLTVEFSGFGVLFYYVRPVKFVPKEVLNTMFLLGLSIGFGIMVWGYGFEMYSREICPKETSFVNGMWPRFLECWGIY